MPLYPSTPLLQPSRSKQDAWPLVIFSHGLAGGRTTYSNFCAKIASEGYVVLAIEHRDGSGPAVRVRPGIDDASSSKNDEGRLLMYSKVDDVVLVPNSFGLDRGAHDKVFQMGERETNNEHHALPSRTARIPERRGLRDICFLCAARCWHVWRWFAPGN